MKLLNFIKAKTVSVKNAFSKLFVKTSKKLSKAKNKITEFLSPANTKVRAFLKENFEVKSSRTTKRIGLVVLIVSLIWVFLNRNAFYNADNPSKWVLLALALMAPFLLCVVVSYSVTIKNELANQIAHLAGLLLMPILTITMTECLNNIFVYDMTYLGFLGNYLVILILYLIVFAISGKLMLSYVIITPILFGFATAHNYLMVFRGTPFIPWDFWSITTAAGVANTYSYAPSYTLVLASLIFLLIMIIGFKTKTPDFHILTKIISRSFSATFCAVLLIVFYATDIFTNLGVTPDFWNQTRGYRNYGFVFSFFSNTKYLWNKEPDGYDHNEVPKYVYDKVQNKENEGDKKPINKNQPNIICIMNESLSDLSVLGDLETNKEYMPFLNSLTENTIKGNLYVPVIGAGTSNTEFEFLTGHTTAFLPSGSNAYMLYINNHIASMVSTMDALGYSSYALHPYYASGWNRTNVYNNLGFDAFTSLDTIIDPEIIEDYNDNANDPEYLQNLLENHYGRDDMIIRQYMSDSYNYELIIKDFEKRDKSVPYFAFNVTMQNHGGYTTSAENFDETIKATNVSKEYLKANKYLSLVKYSDDAFKGLVEYFSNVDEPTIICMFGDHQPSIENEFISEVMGEEDLTDISVEKEQQRHCTPFYIWANYDIEEQYIERLSSNYLSSLVLSTAGVELPSYNKYLLELSKTLPVIDTVGYIDANGVHYKWSESSPYTKDLDEYEKIQWNNLFDRAHIKNDIFYIEGYTPPDTAKSE